MADNSIDLVVSQKAFDQLERLLLKIKEADKAIEALNVNAGKNPTTPSGGEANAAENAKIIAQMKELNAEINRQAEQIKKLQEARKSYSRAITQDTIDNRASNAVLTQNLQLTSKKIGDYQKLDIEYKKAVKGAQDEAAALVAVSKAKENNIDKAKRLSTELQKIDASVGKYNRNVGNYASGWNGLANSVNQLTREAPAFANSLNTGFMALSNNIPILVDEISQLNAKNKDLIKNGKPAESVLGSLSSAFFSLQTVLSVGVTLLTIYGERIVDFIVGNTEAEKSQKKLNDSIFEASKSVESERVNLESLVSIINDENISNATRKQAYDDLVKLLPGFKDMTMEQAIATGDLATATDLYVESELKRIEVEAKIKEIGELQADLDKKKSQSLKERQGSFVTFMNTITFQQEAGAKLAKMRFAKEDAELEKSIKDKKEKVKALLKEYEGAKAAASPFTEDPTKGNKDAAKAEEERLKSIYDARKSAAEADIQLNEERLNNEELFISERLALLDRDKELRLVLAEIDYQEHIRLAKKNQNKLSEAESNFEKDKSKIREDYNKKQLDLIKKQLSAVEKLAKSLNESDPNKMLAKSTKKATKELEKMAAQQQKNIEITKESKKAMKEYTDSFITEFANKSGLTETFKLFTGDNNLFARMSEGMAFTKDSWKSDSVAMMEGVQEMYNFISNASQQNFDAEYARLDKQKEVALQFAGESASAREKVEEDYEKRKKEIANREAQAKKKQAMFNIAIDTAQAVVAALPNIPMSIAIGVLGAVQLALVAAQKIPQYADGTDNHPGGLALINDGKGSNYKETVVTPDGKVRQFSGRDVVIDAPAGTQVFTHDQWNNELNTMMREKGVSMSNSFNSRSGLSYAEMDSIIAKHFSKITTQSTVIDRNGFNTFVSNGSSKTIRNQSRYSGTGFSV